MKVLIYGVGGVGGFIGSFLKKQNMKFHTLLGVKGMNFLKNQGLILNSKVESLKFKNLNVIDQLKEGETFDIIIITVKLYDFDFVIEEINKKIKGNYIILPFQNGIYAEEKIKKIFGPEKTFGAVAQISAHKSKSRSSAYR